MASCAGVGPQTAAPQAMRVFRCWAHRYPARRQQLPTHSAGSLTQQAATRPPCAPPRWALGWHGRPAGGLAERRPETAWTPWTERTGSRACRAGRRCQPRSAGVAWGVGCLLMPPPAAHRAGARTLPSGYAARWLVWQPVHCLTQHQKNVCAVHCRAAVCRYQMAGQGNPQTQNAARRRAGWSTWALAQRRLGERTPACCCRPRAARSGRRSPP